MQGHAAVLPLRRSCWVLLYEFHPPARSHASPRHAPAHGNGSSSGASVICGADTFGDGFLGHITKRTVAHVQEAGANTGTWRGGQRALALRVERRGASLLSGP